MKLFSRKALVAGATALSVAFAGTTVANAEDTTNGSSSEVAGVAKELFNSSSADNNYAGDKEGESKADDSKKEDTRTSKEKADDIKAWIGVFTAVIGALGTLFAFANKYFDLPFGNK
ncbi:hypothetical protein QP958_02425 [Corynebacterium marquesiae]|uniref:hypothetical protein n=1 Tax=Corynebacterium marquesiae TaxID=2913503 RepID=UPI0022BA4F03|nr:hypothetical protein [Corynebacterium marquesiae]MCZ9299723.1 hypothetical protein [Corynebacterium marquesiae]MDK8454265.1 hypothetical protein [Corynebacterium marquesiae]MDK8724382.1 hypothetical protein [Corynebacterium marquesiae]MDK8769702.1 hypothetical protein [Corynebacterium marquesiae]